jgi:predicted DNA-binding transcriptional regulator AlpA
MTNQIEVSPSRRLLRTREVAEMLACSRARVHQLAQTGVLSPVRLVPLGDLRFRVEDVERLIAGDNP